MLLRKGRVLEELSSKELESRCRKCVAVVASDPAGAASALEGAFGDVDLRLEPDGTLLLYDHLDRLGEVSGALSRAGMIVTGMTPKGESLEDYFLRRVGGR